MALAVQLAEPVAGDAVMLGKFWPRVQTDYPNVEPQVPLPPMGEQFEAPGAPTVSFQLMERRPSRYWLLNPDGTELVQVQPDRFAYNWRKELTDAVYPRYQHVRDRFEHAFSTFVETVGELGSEVKPSWAEVSYVNPIVVDDAHNQFRPDLATILKRLAPVHLTVLDQPENTSLSESFVLMRDGAPTGRLHVTAAPALSLQDQAPAYLVTLVARGVPLSPDISGVLAFLDEGRSLIVQSFRDMTTTAMHEKWGLR